MRHQAGGSVLVLSMATFIVFGPRALEAQTVRGGWAEPAGGWIYTYEGDQNACNLLAGGAGPPCEARLDGTWRSLGSSDAWDGRGLGASVGAPGGMDTITLPGLGDEGGDAQVLRVIDPGDPRDNGFADPGNRKIYSGRDLADLGLSPDVPLFTDGATLLFRFRQTPIGDLDPFDITDLDLDGTGYEPFSNLKAVVGVVTRALGTNVNLGFTVLNGKLVVNTVDPPLAIPLCDTDEFVSVWATALDEGAGAIHLTLYLNGSLTPVYDDVVLLGTDAENLGGVNTAHYLYYGLGATGQFGAFDLDYLCFLPEFIDPSGSPAGTVQCPPGMTCLATEDAGDSLVTLSWFNLDSYSSHDILRDNVVIATLAGTVDTYTDVNPSVGQHTYELDSKQGETSCRGTCPALRCEVQVTGQPIQCITDLACGLDAEGVFHVATWKNNDAYTAIDLTIYLEQGEVFDVGGAPCQDGGLTPLYTGPLPPDSTSLSTALFAENQLLPGGIVVMELLARKGDEVCDPVSVQCVRESRCPADLACTIEGTDLVAAWTPGIGLTELLIEIEGEAPILLDDPSVGTATLDITGLDGEVTVILTPTACLGECEPLQCVAGGSQAPLFRRGDSNNDRKLDLSDAVFTLGFLFLGGATPVCDDSADSNDDGKVDLSDAVFGLNYLFAGGAPPPMPGPGDCGPDPTTDPHTECGYSSC